jgi:Bacterial Ig domain
VVRASFPATASVTNAVTSARVQFILDGQVVLGADATPPYAASIDARTVPDGDHTLQATALDGLDRQATSNTVHIRVDNTPPTIAITAPLDNQFVRGSGRFIVEAAAADITSGVASVRFLLDGRAAGTEASSAPVRVLIDNSPPTVACSASDGQWHADDVSLTCSATDGGSGLANGADAAFVLSTSVADGTETADVATGSRQICDRVSNCATAGPIGGSRVDKRPPDVVISVPQDGTTFTVGQVVKAAYACSDAGSGLATCAGPVASDSAIDTHTVGLSTFTVVATDAVGNRSTRSVSYRVVYEECFVGKPDREVKSGATLPIKLYLCDASGADVSSPSIVLTALNMVNTTTREVTPALHPGNADPDNQFKYKQEFGPSGGYMFNLQTTDLKPGSYVLTFQVGSDPIDYSLAVHVR